MVVEVKQRKILGFQVRQSPATGHLAAIARKKYGKRASYRKQGIDQLLSDIKNLVPQNVQIDSDEDILYPPAIQQHLPQANHTTFKGDYPRSYGQGELKQNPRDPLFYINHTFAMCRANLSRLIRRTWSTTKKPERLTDALNIYVYYHNTFLTT
jgi:hypothetical protein